MKPALEIFQILLSFLLIALIFLQATGENESRSNLLAQAGEKRGWDKILFNFTIFVLILFLVSCVFQALAN